MSWTITHDHLENENVAIYGPSSISNEDLAALKAGKGHAFKLYDGDGGLMLSGKSTDNDSEDAFGPLDDYGEPAYGCTSIAYRRNNGGPFTTL
tara:strand:- start:80 stop:358 length:279 start_codon:yes stop_codon:yes gene_type:complete